MFGCLVRAVSLDHKLDGNKREKRITDEDQRELNHDVDSFVMWSPHCNLGTVHLCLYNLLILMAVEVLYATTVLLGDEIRWRELCNENILC